MASLHTEFLEAGARIAGISVDSPEQQAAMVDKLDLGFPLLSDPDRSGAIETPLAVADPDDHREIARPAMILIDPDGEEIWRYVSRDFADRMSEEEVLGVVREQGWSSTTQPAPEHGPSQPGKNAMPLEKLPTYLKGARFAALAMGLRHAKHADGIKADSKAYVAEMDRYIEAVTELLQRTSSN